MKSLTITVFFEEKPDDFEPEYIHLDFKELEVKSEDMTDKELDSVAEGWGQSDWFWSEFNAEILNKMGT